MKHKLSTQHYYEARMLRVIDYLYEHAGAELDVNTLADIACMSAYHFHRIYREYAGETINVTVRRMRMLKAATYLVRSDLSQQQIAKQVCYGSVEAFNRAFTKHYGETPNQYRQQRAYSASHVTALYPTSSKEYHSMYPVEQQNIETIELIGLNHIGDYMQIGQAFEKLSLMAAKADLIDQNTRFFGIYFDDPESVPQAQLKSMACITVDKNKLPAKHAFKQLTIPAGNTVSILFKGDYTELEKPYNWLYGQWLPQSQFELADFPPFEEYLNDLKDTAPQDLLTRINFLVAS
ncbi:AraC family transcriptional regulator [Pseudoalteromonas luteoviolacea]|uniref:AraC family transcriptional regulator n=1 Tax=Pseudoalteromonas luteoviolacea TaxID=43657 RepID=A0A0C1QIZ7_9GAMM|nr:AraC family transcriptional regulator [Pseudoalteromonas luteoviolacea]KID55067.1 AraC family transcriptional regulator [Pseudoalteromonas luteoviolacea]